jgi:hypothetical protein
VLRFEGPAGKNPGAFLGTFVPGGSGGLANPDGMVFGPDPSGNGRTDLYVASSVLSERSGTLMSEPGTSEVLRYDGTTGAFLGAFVTADSGGLRTPTFLTFTETDPTTLNYDGATTNSNLTAATAPTRTATSTVTTNIAGPLIAGSSMSAAPPLAGPTPGNSRIGPAALAVALSLTQPAATPATIGDSVLSFVYTPLPAPALTSDLAPAGLPGSSRPGWTSEATADRVFTRLGAGLSLTALVEDLTLAGGSAEDLTAANLPG